MEVGRDAVRQGIDGDAYETPSEPQELANILQLLSVTESPDQKLDTFVRDYKDACG